MTPGTLPAAVAPDLESSGERAAITSNKRRRRWSADGTRSQPGAEELAEFFVEARGDVIGGA